MALIPPPTVRVPAPLSFEAEASLMADAQFLRKITMAEPERCLIERRPHFWRCEYCNLVRKERPACVLGRDG